MTDTDSPAFTTSADKAGSADRQAAAELLRLCNICIADWDRVGAEDCNDALVARALKERLVSELAEDPWMPIETAPKDGTVVLGYYPDAYQGKGGTFCILWLEREFVTVPGSYRHMKFTRWMPLPPAGRHSRPGSITDGEVHMNERRLADPSRCLITAPLHEETRGKIVTKKRRDWAAHREGEENLDRWGFGNTEKAAVMNLLELERR